MENEQNIYEMQTAKAKKQWYKKWWVWVIVFVAFVVIASSGGNDKKTATTSTKTTPTTEQTNPKATPTPKAKEQPKGPAAATTPANEALSVYMALQDNEVCPYKVSAKAQEFLKNNPNIFPATSIDAVNPLTDTAIEFKHLNKNIANYGDKLISIPEAYVVGIEEEKIGEKTLTSVHVADATENSYQIIYLGSLDDIFKEDTVKVYGLPLGMSSFGNVSGGTTIVAVVAGSYIKKL